MTPPIHFHKSESCNMNILKLNLCCANNKQNPQKLSYIPSSQSIIYLSRYSLIVTSIRWPLGLIKKKLTMVIASSSFILPSQLQAFAFPKQKRQSMP